MDPAVYEAWYATPRGRWVAETEFALLMRLLDLPPGASLLDIGCGTGQFSRRFAQAGYRVTGIDPDPERIAYARTHAQGSESYLTGDGTQLTFADKQFDAAVAVTSLCFVADQLAFVKEMARVARQRIALGLLNRHSLLYSQKHGQGGYRGAHWHSLAEARGLLAEAKMSEVGYGSAVFLPDGGTLARVVERLTSVRLPFGGFLAIAAALPSPLAPLPEGEG